jgi:nucleotide-binding universal stress UspA family protein
MLAESDEPSLIIMSSHGRGRMGRAVLGSVAEAVVAQSSVPVLIVGPEFNADDFDIDSSVLLAHDNVHSPDVDDVARIARACGGYVGVVEVFRTIEPTPFEQCSPRVEECANELRDAGLTVVCESWPGDDPAEIIVEQATLQRSSFIALTSKVEEGASRIAHGSIAAKVVHTSPVPVLMMAAKPIDDVVQV